MIVVTDHIVVQDLAAVRRDVREETVIGTVVVVAAVIVIVVPNQNHAPQFAIVEIIVLCQDPQDVLNPTIDDNDVQPILIHQRKSKNSQLLPAVYRTKRKLVRKSQLEKNNRNVPKHY